MWAGIGKQLLKKALWEGTKSLGKHGGKLGLGLAEQLGWKDAALGAAKSGFMNAAENIGKSHPYGGGMYGGPYY